jgi:hypothetical protein
MTDRGSHREGEDLDRIVSELTAVRELLARGSTGGGLAATTVEALGQLLARSDTMVRLLEQIACHTCETWNEIHIQTDLQTDSREAVTTLVELVKSAYPNAAVELERLRVLTARVDDCCPSAYPEPVCTLELCPPEPEHGDAELQHGSAATNTPGRPTLPTPGPPSRRWTRPRYSRPSPPRTPRATSWTTACAVTKSSSTYRRSTGSSG